MSDPGFIGLVRNLWVRERMRDSERLGEKERERQRVLE